jgi:hypothetical protein
MGSASGATASHDGDRLCFGATLVLYRAHRFDPFVAELRFGMITFAMDRRGSGASGYAAACSIESWGSRMWGLCSTPSPPAPAGRSRLGPFPLLRLRHGRCRVDQRRRPPPALRAEPRARLSEGSIEAVEQALAAVDREAAIRLVVGGILEMSEEAVEEMRADPAMVAAVISSSSLRSAVHREGLLQASTTPFETALTRPSHDSDVGPADEGRLR